MPIRLKDDALPEMVAVMKDQTAQSSDARPPRKRKWVDMKALEEVCQSTQDTVDSPGKFEVQWTHTLHYNACGVRRKFSKIGYQ